MSYWDALPTWLIVRFLQRFLPKNHPWYARRFTLEDWATHRTQFTRDCDLYFWVSAVLFALLALSVWSR